MMKESMDQNEILELFKSVDAITTDSHIIYTSGKHGSSYFNKDALYPHTEKVSILCKELAKKFKEDDIEAVIAPALGGIVLSQWIAHHLSKLLNKDVLALYAEKTEEGGFTIKRGYEKILPGKNTLIAEDVLTTGGSAKKVSL